ncbi:hypothetical protein Gotur_014162, partial [Gossypium turneri]
MESEFAGLSLDKEEEEILQVQDDSNPVSEEEILSLVGCFLTASIIHYTAMKITMANLWHPVRGVQIRDLGEKRFKNKYSYVRFQYERLTLFCFYCGRLGHNDSFCEAKMEAGVEVNELGWDVSLRAQSRRAQAISSVWLREEGGSEGGANKRSACRGNRDWGCVKNFKGIVDPILGFNLKGNRLSLQTERKRVPFADSQTAMEHDLENEMIIGEEGKKRVREDI